MTRRNRHESCPSYEKTKKPPARRVAFHFGRDLPRASKRRRKLPLMRLGLRFRRAVRLRRPVTAFRHELVEFGLVLGVPHPVKEIAAIALLLLPPPHPP